MDEFQKLAERVIAAAKRESDAIEVKRSEEIGLDPSEWFDGKYWTIREVKYIGSDLGMVATAYISHDGFGGGGALMTAYASVDNGEMLLVLIVIEWDGDYTIIQPADMTNRSTS